MLKLHTPPGRTTRSRNSQAPLIERNPPMTHSMTRVRRPNARRAYVVHAQRILRRIKAQQDANPVVKTRLQAATEVGKQVLHKAAAGIQAAPSTVYSALRGENAFNHQIQNEESKFFAQGGSPSPWSKTPSVAVS
jgi:hypothetical protein